MTLTPGLMQMNIRWTNMMKKSSRRRLAQIATTEIKNLQKTLKNKKSTEL